MTVRAAAAQIEITPPVGVELSGYAARQQPSIGLLDPLYARGLYLEQGAERLLWVHADLIGFGQEQARRFRRRVCAELGFQERQVLLSATHTHAGPATVVLRECGLPDVAYLAELDERLLTVARMAAMRPQPATLHFAEGACDLARDRRPPSELSHVDHRLPVWALRREDGSHLAVVANYPMHNVALSARNRLISADVAGQAAEGARRALPGAPVVLVTNGGCGNLNPPASAEGPDLMQAYGQRLVAAIRGAMEAAVPCEPTMLASALATERLPLMVLSPDDVEAEHARAVAALDPSLGESWLRAMDRWRAETLALIAHGAPDHVATDVQVVRLGPATLAAIGAEVFSRMADELRAILGPRTYVVGYANGDLGYMPPREVYAEGGYEVDLAFKFYGHFMIVPGSYELVRDLAIALARGLGAG
jgi:hypothetical protein